MTEPINSVALWTPPAGNRRGEEWVAQQWIDRASRFRDEELHRMLAGEAVLAEHALDRPHWHLALLATDREHQGRGMARAVLEPILEQAAQEELPVSLATANPENLAVYARFGFEISAEVDLPDGGPHVWALVRP
ncbi:MAG: GNAT family N-acetyltransferase [Acidimicrobiia bacterium]